MKKKIGRIILSKIPRMPLEQYLKYIDMKTLVEPCEHKFADRNLPASYMQKKQAGKPARYIAIRKAGKPAKYIAVRQAGQP